MKIIDKKHIFVKIFLLIIFLVLLFSCEKKNNVSEESEDKIYSDNLEELPPFNDLSDLYSNSNGTLLYKYDGYWSMRFGEYFKLDNRNKCENNKNKDFHTEWEGTGYIPEGPPK